MAIPDAVLGLPSGMEKTRASAELLPSPRPSAPAGKMQKFHIRVALSGTGRQHT